MLKTGGGVGVNAGAVPLRPLTGSVGCALIDVMRRATPKGAAKPWKTVENRELIERVAGAGVPVAELEAYIVGCSALVEARQEAPIYWTVRQLFTSPTMDWWRGKVAAAEQAAADREAYELDQQARAAREQVEKEARREMAKAAPADLGIRRAAAPMRAEVVQRARVQELAGSVVARLSGGSGGPVPCPKCEATVSASEAKCPACHAVLIDARGDRRRGMGRGLG